VCSCVEDGSALHFVVSLEGENYRCFEDRERTVVDLKSFFFKNLYHWIDALDLNLLNFHEFLELFSISS
jgi:hypothetical protein